jgi:hypothetical protein
MLADVMMPEAFEYGAGRGPAGDPDSPDGRDPLGDGIAA